MQGTEICFLAVEMICVVSTCKGTTTTSPAQLVSNLRTRRIQRWTWTTDPVRVGFAGDQGIWSMLFPRMWERERDCEICKKRLQTVKAELGTGRTHSLGLDSKSCRCFWFACRKTNLDSQALPKGIAERACAGKDLQLYCNRQQGAWQSVIWAGLIACKLEIFFRPWHKVFWNLHM